MIAQFGWDQILSLILFILFLLLFNEIQVQIFIWSLKSFIEEITVYEKLSYRLLNKMVLNWIIQTRNIDNPVDFARAFKESPDYKRVSRLIDESINTFTIMPVTLDPSEILARLEHILDIRRRRMSNIAKRIIDMAPENVQKNLESALEAAAAIRYLAKFTKHLYHIGMKTKNIQYLFQLKLFVPFLRELCMSYFDALKAFVLGVPIGDSVGALVAQRFFGESVEVDEKNKVVISSSEIDGRYILAVKALGPGSEVGYPGRFLEEIIQKLEGNIDAIITVDAALRFESEERGRVDVGFGAAIGDPGPEKFRIERWATKYKIPLFAVVIRENYLEALTPLGKEFIDAVDKAYKVILELIEEEVPEGGKVILLGIGNSIGVGSEPLRVPSNNKNTISQ